MHLLKPAHLPLRLNILLDISRTGLEAQSDISAPTILRAFASLRETNSTDLAAYLRLDCRATLAKAYDADLEHGAFAL
jgi:hypothetical protein